MYEHLRQMAAHRHVSPEAEIKYCVNCSLHHCIPFVWSFIHTRSATGAQEVTSWQRLDPKSPFSPAVHSEDKHAFGLIGSEE